MKKYEFDNCIIFPLTIIVNDVIIKSSIIGKDCNIKSGIKIITCILGTNIDLDKYQYREEFIKKMNK